MTVRVPGFLRTLILSLVARMPLAATGLVLVLAVRDLGHSYALAGLCNGMCAVGMAAGGPVLGRLIDRLGQTMVLLASTAVAVVATIAFGVMPAASAGVALAVMALVIGFAQPPVAACARAIWRGSMDDRRFESAVTMDASLQELAFMGGPLLLIGAASAFGPAVALVLTGLMLGAATAAFALLPETRAITGTGHDRHRSRLGALRSRGVRTLVTVAAAVGAMFGATEIGIIVVADEHGARGMSGVLFAAWSLGSMAAGLLAARYPPRTTPARWMMFLLAILAATTAALAFATTLPLLAAGLVLAGAGVAPLFGVLYSAMGAVAPDTALTEAFTLETSGIMAGLAIGSAAGGGLAEATGPWAAFLLGAIAAVLAAVVLWTRRTSVLAQPGTSPA